MKSSKHEDEDHEDRKVELSGAQTMKPSNPFGLVVSRVKEFVKQSRRVVGPLALLVAFMCFGRSCPRY